MCDMCGREYPRTREDILYELRLAVRARGGIERDIAVLERELAQVKGADA